MAGWLLGTADGEEVERLLLDGCWPCGDSDREVWRDCGGDGVARQCRDVCDQAVEAVDRQAVVGLFGGLFVECCWGPLGFGDNAGAQGLSARSLSVSSNSIGASRWRICGVVPLSVETRLTATSR